MTYQWTRVADKLIKYKNKNICIKSDLQRISKNFYGPVNSPLSSKPICLIIGYRSGLEAEYIKITFPDAIILVLDESDLHLNSDYTLIKSLEELKNILESLECNLIDYCRIDEQHFSDDLIDILLKNKIKINYLCGAVNSTIKSNYMLHRDLSCIADLFYINLINSKLTLSKSERGFKYYVSVVVPAYGVEKYLPKCLESLVNQSLKEIEIIVVDDGAKDNSGVIADEWAKQYPDKVRVIHQKNGGCASARNAGLLVASGYYVGFVDGDDWVSSTMFEDLINAILPGFKDIGQCGFTEVYENGTTKIRSGSEPIKFVSKFPHETNYKPDYILNSPSIWRRIYRNNFLQKHEINFNENIKRFDDLPFAFLALSLAQSIVIIPESHYFYRLGRPGQDVGFNDERLFIHFEIFEFLYDEIRIKYDGNLYEHLDTIEKATHKWALSFIQKELFSEYSAKVKESIKLHKSIIKIYS